MRGKFLDLARADGGDFACDAAIRKQVGPVGRDFNVEHRVAGHVLAEDFPDRRVGRQDEQALRILGQREFLRGAEHALGQLAAQLRFLDDEVAGQLRAGQGERRLVAVLEIFRAADDLAHAVAVVDLADAQAVGVRMRHGRKDLPDDDVRRVDAGAVTCSTSVPASVSWSSICGTGTVRST